MSNDSILAAVRLGPPPWPTKDPFLFCVHHVDLFPAGNERLGPAARPPDARYGRHAGLVAVPHGAKTYLAAALVLTSGERVVWIARDAEVGDRVAEELQAWLGDPGAVAVLEPRTALAYERSELVADETAARVAALAAWRTGQARVRAHDGFPVRWIVLRPLMRSSADLVKGRRGEHASRQT